MRFEPVGGLSLDEAIHRAGHVPLPPYITDYEGDLERYQTVYSMREEHSAAAPTAGLHFTPELIRRIRGRDIDFRTVELEVGIDTFRLVEEDGCRTSSALPILSIVIVVNLPFMRTDLLR